MRRPIHMLLVFAMIAALAAPAVAFAQGGNDKSGDRGHGSQSTASGDNTRGDQHADKTDRSTARSERAADHKAKKAAHKGDQRAERAARKALRKAEKDARKAAHRAEKAAHEASCSVDPDDADETSGSVEPTGSVEATRAVGPGVLNAFARITANLEKSLAKIAEGKKSHLPRGLVRTWLKFATWLGVDKATMPGLPAPDPDWTIEPTGTVVPTSTVEPTGTVVPTDTVTPTSTIEPALTPAP